MTRPATDDLAHDAWPHWWRMLLIGLSTLILCSCRAPGDYSDCREATVGLSAAAVPSLTLPEQAYTGAMAQQPHACDRPVGPPGPPGMEQGVPLPYSPAGPWSPPGISQPWPTDEYLRDGGDRGLPAEVDEQWEVRGLELEDTIAHYDTLDGRRLVQPSNRVHLYSPRFGAVRKVVSLVANEQARRATGVHVPTKPAGPTGLDIVTSSTQNVQAVRQIGTKPPVIFQSRQGDGAISSAVKAKAYQDTLLPYEAPQMIRDGIIDAAEMPFLARGAAAAIAWTSDQAVQVILDHQAAMAEVSDQTADSVYTFKAPPGDPKLRVVKVASTPFAEPGDEVAFTIRFDNVGNQTIGNVTIIDNLTTRLEYVPDSAQCSLDANFLTQPNQGDSLVLRCEITNPLKPDQGGVIRFRCRVR